MTHVAVLGPGGVGGLIAAALDRAGTPTTVVAREETVAVLERDGIEVSSVRLGDFVARPRAVAQLTMPVGVLFVATKAVGLERALARVAPNAPQVVVPLLNGLDHVGVLREYFGAERVVTGVIRVESDRPKPGVIVHTSPFLRVDLEPDPRAEGIAHVLRAAEIPTKIGESEAAVLWGKLVRLNALACTTTAHDAPLGEIRTRADWRAELLGAIEEGAAIAGAEGAPVSSEKVVEELWAAHATLGSSMQRDVAAGRAPELDAIPGAVLRAADRHGVPAPTIAALVEQIRARLP